MRIPSSVTEFPTISPGLQKKTTTKLVNAAVPLNSTTPIALINGRTSELTCLTQCIHSNTHTSLKFFIPSSPCLPWKLCYTSFSWANLSGSGFLQLDISTVSPSPCQSVKSFIIVECLLINKLALTQLYVPSLLTHNPQDPGSYIFSQLLQVCFGSNFGRPSSSLAQLGCVLILDIGLVVRAGEAYPEEAA